MQSNTTIPVIQGETFLGGMSFATFSLMIFIIIIITIYFYYESKKLGLSLGKHVKDCIQKNKLFSIIIFLLSLTLISSNDLIGWIPVLLIGYLIYNKTTHWKLWFLGIASVIIGLVTILLNIGISFHLLEYCKGGLGSGISCQYNWMEGLAFIPVMISFYMILFGLPLWIWLGSLIINIKIFTKIKTSPLNSKEEKSLYYMYILSLTGILSGVIFFGILLLPLLLEFFYGFFS